MSIESAQIPTMLNIFEHFNQTLSRHRIVAIGEQHRISPGGDERITTFAYPSRCVRSFVSHVVQMQYHGRFDRQGALIPHRLRGLALEIDEAYIALGTDRSGTGLPSWEDFRTSAPTHISARVAVSDNQGLGGFPTMPPYYYHTETRPVLNKKALWLALGMLRCAKTHNHAWDTSYCNMLLDIATSIPDDELIIRGIDSDSFGVESNDRGVQRDRIIIQRFAQLLQEVSDVDPEGKILVLMGAAHTTRRGGHEYPGNNPRQNDAYSQIGGVTPIGSRVDANEFTFRVGGEARRLTPNDYYSYRCLVEGTDITSNYIDVTDLGTPNSDPLFDFSVESEFYGLSRAYDLLSSFSLETGAIETFDLETQVPNALRLTRPELNRSRREANRSPISTAFNGLLYFRDLDSFHPPEPGFAPARDLIERREEQYLISYFIPGAGPRLNYDPDHASLADMERSWIAYESLLNAATSFGGMFGTRSDETSESAFPGLSDMPQSYRRSSFALPSPSSRSQTEFVIRPRDSIVLLGYGFGPRTGDPPTDPLRIVVTVANGTGVQVARATCNFVPRTGDRPIDPPRLTVALGNSAERPVEIVGQYMITDRTLSFVMPAIPGLERGIYSLDFLVDFPGGFARRFTLRRAMRLEII